MLQIRGGEDTAQGAFVLIYREAAVLYLLLTDVRLVKASFDKSC